jgi:multiple sugar transport system substrate-binding protein
MRYAVAALIAVVALGIYLLSTQPAEQAAPHQTQIRFAFPGSVKSISLFSRLVRRFMELNPDIHVKLEPNVGDFRQIIKRDLVADIAPDVFFSDDDYFTVFAADGHYLALDGLIARDAYDTSVFYGPAAESFRWEGKTYGLPFGWGCSLLLYNRQALRDAGIEYDPTQWTWEQFSDTVRRCTGAAQVKGRTVQRYGYMRDNAAHAMCNLWQGGGRILQKAIVCPHCDRRNDVDDIVEPDRATCGGCGRSMSGGRAEWRAACDSSKAVAGIQYMLSLLPYTPRAVASDASEMPSNQEMFATGRLAVIRGGPYSAQWAAEIDVDWGIGYFPAGPGGRWTRFYCDGFVIGAKTEHPNEAWRLLKYLCGDDAQRLLAKEAYHVPVRRSVARSPYFDRPDTPWDESIFAGAIEHVRFQRKIPEWDEAYEILARNYGLLMLDPESRQHITAAEFLARCQREIERDVFDRP